MRKQALARPITTGRKGEPLSACLVAMYLTVATHLQSALDTEGVSLSLSGSHDKNRPKKYSQVDEMQRPQSEQSCGLLKAERTGNRPP